MASPDPVRRSEAARYAATIRWSKEDPHAGTAKARAGFEQKFLDQVDPDQLLDPAERQRRANKAKSRHFKALRARRSELERKRSVEAAPDAA